MSDLIEESSDSLCVSQIEGDSDSSLAKPPKLLRYQGSAPAHVVESMLLETIGQLRLALLALSPEHAESTSIGSTQDRVRTLQGMLIRKLGPIVECMRDLQACTLRKSHQVSRQVLVDLYDLAASQASWKLDDKSSESLGIELLSETIRVMNVVRSACVGAGDSTWHDVRKEVVPPVS